MHCVPLGGTREPLNGGNLRTITRGSSGLGMHLRFGITAGVGCSARISVRKTGSRRNWGRIRWTIHRCRCLCLRKHPYSTRSPGEHSGGTLATQNLIVFKHLYGLSTGYMIHGATDSDSTLHIKRFPEARKPGQQGSACSWSGSYSGRACLLSRSSSRSASRIFCTAGCTLQGTLEALKQPSLSHPQPTSPIHLSR